MKVRSEDAKTGMKNVSRHIDTECGQWQLTAGNIYRLKHRCSYEYKEVDVKVESIRLEIWEMELHA